MVQSHEHEFVGKSQPKGTHYRDSHLYNMFYKGLQSLSPNFQILPTYTIKRNSSRRSTAYQLYQVYTWIVITLHLKGWDGINVLRFSVSQAFRSKVIIPSRLLAITHITFKEAFIEWLYHMCIMFRITPDMSLWLSHHPIILCTQVRVRLILLRPDHKKHSRYIQARIWF